MISSFYQENEFLHNSAEKIGDNGRPLPFIEYEDVRYTNVTSAFLASQIRDTGLRHAFSLLSADEAMEKFDEWKDVIPSFIDPSFEANKKDILFLLLSRKFSDEFFLKKLLDTGEEELVFVNSYGDKFLGVCDGDGENVLGETLMEIRNRKRDEFIKKDSYIYSIGYGNLRMQDFLHLLKDYGIEIIIDIRINSISHNKLFGSDALSNILSTNNIKYIWCGNVFPEVNHGQIDLFNENGHVIYEKMWDSKKNNKLKAFCDKAIQDKKKICFLSSEFNPQHCHRGRLIGENALTMGIDICHIIPTRDGIKLLYHSELEPVGELGISYKSYWGWTPEACSIIEHLDDLVYRYLHLNDMVLYQKMSEDEKLRNILIELDKKFK